MSCLAGCKIKMIVPVRANEQRETVPSPTANSTMNEILAHALLTDAKQAHHQGPSEKCWCVEACEKNEYKINTTFKAVKIKYDQFKLLYLKRKTWCLKLNKLINESTDFLP